MKESKEGVTDDRTPSLIPSGQERAYAGLKLGSGLIFPWGITSLGSVSNSSVCFRDIHIMIAMWEYKF